jgi:RNA polymerase sigma-70 factor (ECF subfamily)
MQSLMEPWETTREQVEQARSGDRAAFAALVEGCRPQLAAAVARWLRFQLGPPIEVEDVIQDAIVRALGSLDRFEWQGGDSFLRWLIVIARRALSDAAQRARRQPGGIGSTDAPASGPSPSRTLRREERLDRLRAALAKLSPEHRQVVELSRLEGLSAVAIAERIGRSPNAVRHLLVRALRDLREHFGDTGSLSLPAPSFDPGEDGDHGR